LQNTITIAQLKCGCKGHKGKEATMKLMKLGGYTVLAPLLLVALFSLRGVIAQEQTCSADDGDCSAAENDTNAVVGCANKNDSCDLWASLGEFSP
jgi:hypothetical protein